MIPAVMNNFVLLCGIGSFAMFLIDALTRLKSDTISLVAINAIIYTANTTNVPFTYVSNFTFYITIPLASIDKITFRNRNMIIFPNRPPAISEHKKATTISIPIIVYNAFFRIPSVTNTL